MLDYNEDRSLKLPLDRLDRALSNFINRASNRRLNFDTAVGSIQSTSAKIQINTLSPYIGYGGGRYMMTDVKRMTAKEDFLKMSLKNRKCEVELYEDCRTRKLLEECKCVPWEMSGFQV